jgi:transcriptional regulator with XRE-family HTH domain
MSAQREPTRDDKMVGFNLFMIRESKKIPREKLCQRLGVSVWQLSKYENGDNRISVGRLVECARVLRVPISRFFRGIEVHHG